MTQWRKFCKKKELHFARYSISKFRDFFEIFRDFFNFEHIYENTTPIFEMKIYRNAPPTYKVKIY